VEKNLVLFQVYTGEKSYVDNLLHFLYFSNLPDRNTELVVVEVGEPLSDVKLLFPDVRFIRVENTNLDFGAYAQAIEAIDTSNYSMLMFINCTVRGPFMGSNLGGNWIDRFSSELGDRIQLVGPTINMLPLNSEYGQVASNRYGVQDFYPHVQSMAFALGRTAMDLLLENGFWNTADQKSKEEVIVDYEIGLSHTIVSNGYSIKSLVPKPGVINSATFLHPLKKSRSGDVNFRRAYGGRTLSPYELIFVKTNRNMISRRKLRKVSRKEIKYRQVSESNRNPLVEGFLSSRKII
jgi:hypothetical protein